MAEISEKFIEKLLIDKENDKSIRIKKINSKPAVGKGENFMSVAIKIQVEGSRIENNKTIDFTKSLFMKKQFESQEATEFLQSDNIFENEALAYNEVIPVLEEYLEEDIAAAKCYTANKKCLIFEDLFSKGYGMIEGQKSLTLEQCCAVLQELAKLHSASYILKSKNPKKFDELASKLYEVMSEDNKMMPTFLEKTFENNIKLLETIKPQTTELKEIMEKMEKVRPTIIQDVIQLLNKTTSTDVINHGDCWMNNLLFKNLPVKEAKTNPPISVKLVDLQIMRYTSPAADLSYFLYINLFPAFRKEKTDYLLNFYLKQLHSSLKKHNLTDLIEILNFTWIKMEMKRFAKFGLMFGLMIFPVFYVNKNELPDMEDMTQDMIDNNDENIAKWMQDENNLEYHKVLIEFLKMYFNENDA